MKDKVKGFVLSNQPYKEKDAIVRVFTQEYGILSFIIKGYYRTTSKQIGLGMEHNKIEYYFNYKEGLNSLIHGQVLESYRNKRDNYEWLIRSNFASEVLLKFGGELNSTETMDILEKLYNEKEWYTLIELLIYVIKTLGVNPYLKGCVRCNKTNINSFSINQGGYLCQEHSMSKNSYDELVEIGTLFNSKWDQLDRDKEVDYINIISNYIEFHLETKIHSRKLLNNV